MQRGVLFNWTAHTPVAKKKIKNINENAKTILELLGWLVDHRLTREWLASNEYSLLDPVNRGYPDNFTRIVTAVNNREYNRG